jgi:hypothetical protein
MCDNNLLYNSKIEEKIKTGSSHDMEMVGNDLRSTRGSLIYGDGNNLEEEVLTRSLLECSNIAYIGNVRFRQHYIQSFALYVSHNY